MPRETCKDCRWWLKSPQSDVRGECHFDPPCNADENGEAVWPVTVAKDFCGKWAAR